MTLSHDMSHDTYRYDPRCVVSQLRACGVLETIRISAAGYPSRWGYREFSQRYHPLLPPGGSRKGAESALTTSILNNTIKVRNVKVSELLVWLHRGKH